MDTPTYHCGQRVALAFIESEQAPGTYHLRRNDGSTYAITWRPRERYSMQLPPLVTLWAEVTKRSHCGYTLSLPAAMGSTSFTLTATELAACDREIPAED